MSLTINEMYQAAADNETSWEHALLLTGLLYVGVEGLMVSPPPENKDDYKFYRLRLDILLKYSNDNSSYQEVTKTLQEYSNKIYKTL